MLRQYSVMPLPSHRIEEMKKNSLYNELITKYGEENVVNNYIVDVVILQEERDIFSSDGTLLHITKDYSGTVGKDEYVEHFVGIKDVFKNSQTIYEKWLSAPINNLKSKLTEDLNYLGTAPLITDHEESMENKHGMLISGSLRLVTIDDKLHLLGKILLISPESKFNWLQGIWREISPGLMNYKIREISFVTIPAQMNNTTLSSGEKDNININLLPKHIDPIDELDKKLNLSKAKYEQQIFDYKLQQKEKQSIQLTDSLIHDGIIGSNKRKTMYSELLQLSSGESQKVVNLIQKIGVRSPLQNKPKMVLIKGDHEVDKNARFAKFQAENASNFKTGFELQEAFNIADAEFEKTLNLSAGKGKIETIEDDKEIKKKHLKELADGEEELDEDQKKHIKKLYKKHKLNDGEEDDVEMANGETDAGGVTHSDNTKLSNGESSVDYVKNLESAYDEIKKHYNEAKEELAQQKAKLNTIRKQIGD